MVYRIFHVKLTNDRTRIFSCDEQKRGNQEPRMAFHQ